MRNSKLLFSVIFFIYAGSIYSQSIQKPSLSHKKTTKTLIIDSIPVIKPNKVAISNISISKRKDKYAIFFSSSDSYPSIGFSNRNRQFINTKSAFNQELPLEPLTYNNHLLKTWDKPYGQGPAAILVGTLNLISDLLTN